MTETRRCRICKETKPIERFEIDRRYKDGHFTFRCKQCKNASQDKAARALQHMRERAAKDGREVEVTLSEIQTLFDVFESCAYCGKKQSECDSVFHVEHLIPLSEEGSSSLSNLCIACPTCNAKKGAKPLVSYFFENRERIGDSRFVLLAHYVAITSKQPVEDVVYDMADQHAQYELRKMWRDFDREVQRDALRDS